MIPLLARIERANLILAVALTTVAGLLWGRAGTLGAGAGALLACADFFVLGRLGARAIAQVRAGGSPWGLGLALVGKMTALFALVFIAIRVLRLAVAPFALGFSVFVVSILMVSFSAGIGRSEAGA
jgi:hypothetical protein